MAEVSNPVRPRRRGRRRAVVISTAAVALFVGGAIGLGLPNNHADVAAGAPGAAADADGGAARAVAPAGVSGSEISRLQSKLAENPADAAGWATLGSAYVQQARITLDPSYYPKAQGALERSLQLAPNNLAALVGMGALSNARHNFAEAARWGRKAVSAGPYNPSAHAVLADAYTQLGKPARATQAVQRMLDLSPALPALTRGSYDLEQRGDTEGARQLMQRALDDAFTPADIGFCRYYLGELAFSSGDLTTAARQYSAGLAADPQSAQLLQGRAKVAALQGKTAAAAADYAQLVGLVPNPQYVVEYGELLSLLGRDSEARAQFALVGQLYKIFADNGGTDSLGEAEFEADHGSPADALRYAREEWDRRHSVVVADALAWALHRAGRDGEALHYSDLAVARGWHNALFFHHRAQIHRSLGNAAAARADAATARRYNPAFNNALPSFGRAT